MTKKENEIVSAKEKLIIENFHRVSKQLGMVTEATAITPEKGMFDKNADGQGLGKPVEEIFGMGKSKEEKQAELLALGMKVVNGHPMKQKVYNQLKAQDPAKADEYVIFLAQNPNARQIGWDQVANKFVDKAVASHGIASGA